MKNKPVNDHNLEEIHIALGRLERSPSLPRHRELERAVNMRLGTNLGNPDLESNPREESHIHVIEPLPLLPVISSAHRVP